MFQASQFTEHVLLNNHGSFENSVLSKGSENKEFSINNNIEKLNKTSALNRNAEAIESKPVSDFEDFKNDLDKQVSKFWCLGKGSQ